MKKSILILSVLFINKSFAAGGLSQLLNIPDGISIGWDGAVIANSDYSIRQVKNGKRVQYKKQDTISFKTDEKGNPLSVTYKSYDGRKISHVNFADGQSSATRCELGKNFAQKTMLRSCVTVSKKTCQILLKITGSKNFDEFLGKAEVCRNLMDASLKEQMVHALDLEKRNANEAQQNFGMLWSDFDDSITRDFLLIGTGDDRPAVFRNLRYLSQASYMCSSDIFSQESFKAPATINFERAGAQ